MLTSLQYRILKRIAGAVPNLPDEYTGKSKLSLLLGPDFLPQVAGKTVLDFGCGNGTECIEIARAGAARVLGVDIREAPLSDARRAARAAGVESRCCFTTTATEAADMIICLDAFEHFADPAAVLATMASWLRPGGAVYVSFGPPWYHPLGGHFFSIFPWSHLIFSESALIRWRSDFKSDGATRFGEVSGGLNQMSIGRFVAFIAASPLRFAHLETVPIRKLRHLHNRLTREFTTAVVRCRLVART